MGCFMNRVNMQEGIVRVREDFEIRFLCREEGASREVEKEIIFFQTTLDLLIFNPTFSDFINGLG